MPPGIACAGVYWDAQDVVLEDIERIEVIRGPGGTVWGANAVNGVIFSPGEKHWHEAAPTTAMTHIAVQEKLDGTVVEGMEKVSDEQYRKSPR